MKVCHAIPLFCYMFHLILIGIGSHGALIGENSLKLVYVLFRHGNRTPNGPEEVYPRDPYRNAKYPLIGTGQLTQAGKVREYLIGKALRQRYDKFLGPYYSPDIIEPISTDYNRTKMSLLLALDGLFPPRGQQIWQQNLRWQPIPYNYVPESQDKILMGHECPYFIKLYQQYKYSPQLQATYWQYKQIFDYISYNSGLNVTSFEDLYNLSFGLKAEEDMGYVLPAWTKKVWPDIIMNLAIQQYYVYTGTLDLRRMIGGYFIQKVINDISNHINGLYPERKIYLVSAHELNVAVFLLLLDVFKPHLPNYGAYVTLEVHKKNGVYGIQIYYQNYNSSQPVKLKMPHCDFFCPFDTFKCLMQDYIPPSPDFCYQQ